ncbi:MAG: hypothetical protein AAGP08_18505, partial [Pseudomonadota bacterium]
MQRHQIALRAGRSAPRAGMAVFAALAVLALSGCADDEVILEGERLDVRAPLSGTVNVVAPLEDETPSVDAAFVMPEATRLAAWTHANGSPTLQARLGCARSVGMVVWCVG